MTLVVRRGQDAVSAEAREALSQGSRSFDLAARLLPPAEREDATLLYHWCRYLDDEVDGQAFGQGRVSGAAHADDRLARLRAATVAAHAGERQAHPAFEGFRRVAARRAIPLPEALALLDGFAMDVGGRRYGTFKDTLDYCYHVAGVVGVMMGRVLGVTDERVLDRACDLGIAFQLTNIARDIVDDWMIGRVYLPGDWLADEGLDPQTLGVAGRRRTALARVARRLIEAAEPYYASADIGVAALPPRSAWAIAAARAVYREIGRQVLRQGAAAWDDRAVVSRPRKAALIARAALPLAFRRGGSKLSETRCETLYSRRELLAPVKPGLLARQLVLQPANGRRIKESVGHGPSRPSVA